MKHKTAAVLFVLLVFAGAIVFFAACRKSTKPAFDAAAHRSEIQKWQNDRLTSLTKDDGWLTLVGLFWLNEGENKFGSDAKNAVVLPKDKSPGMAGSFWLEQGRVRLVARPEAGIGVQYGNVDVKRDAKPITNFDLKDDNDDAGPTILYLGSLIINVVKRGERIGVRVKDRESRTRREFKGLEYFPIDPKWRVEARLEPYQPPKTIPITNVLSMTDNETSPGALAFEVDGKTYRIDPILEKGETDWFIMIADETTGRETYGAGRYLYVTPPDATGKVVVDFNKTYSPPCAFTNYATCPLPPQQNHLPFRIEAGEKKYAGTVH
ncbi:MAG TPA: DUF1684 domain-containing protein [Pyrinomonadaceae bacterium]|jgi:uncharacterized protein (DUF1684 family)|nr:DUF1684 domain-containing protein [Pyrinomonadaceae bacterium]